MVYIAAMPEALVTVVEMPSFQRRADALLSVAERTALIEALARDPLAGDLIPETGGLRKLRWSVKGRGERGGVRAVYYFHSLEIPVYAIALYANNERADLTPAQKAEARRLVELLKAGARRRGAGRRGR